MRALRPLRSILLLAVALFTLPAHAAVTEVTTPAGLKAWLVEDHSQPLFTMAFSFEGGAALDAEGKEGLSTLLAATLDEGARDLDSRAFQAALSERSISLYYRAEEDAIFGNLKALAAERDNAFGLLGLSLHQPRFDVEAISRMKAALVSQRQAGLSDANWLASQAFEQIALSGHPYGRPGDGTLSSLDHLTRDDLVAAAKARFTRDRLRIAVVGDITPSELAKKLDEVFASLPAAQEPLVLPPLKVQGAGEVALIHRNQPQTMLLLGTQGLTREDPDWFPALIMSHVLGGDFQSRLMREIRVKRGLTYGVSTALVPYKAGGVLYAMASSDNGKVAELIEQLKAEWQRMAMQGVTAEELLDAKTYLTGSFALRFGSSGGIAAVLLDIQRLGYAPSYLEERATRINEVTQADVARVAERLLNPSTLTMVAVGQPEGVTATRNVTIEP